MRKRFRWTKRQVIDKERGGRQKEREGDRDR